MGLLNLIPGFQDSPVGSWWNTNNDTVSGALTGLVGHGNDPRAILMGALGGLKHGKSVDEEQAIIAQEKRKQQAELDQQAAQQNVTRKRLADWGYADLVDAMDGGMSASEVWGEALKRRSPKVAEPLKPTADIQEYEYAKSQGYTGTLQEYQTEMRKAGATNIDFNANQGTAAAFADRMTAAEQVLSNPQVEAALTSVEQDLKSQAPFGVDNFLVSPEYQMADQAKRDFINAILRRESGAVISPSEFENAEEQYFPRPGDSPQVIAQKKRNREIALEGVRRAAGPNYTPPSLVPGGVVDPYDKYGLERP